MESTEINLDRLAHCDSVDCPDISTRLGVELLILECHCVLTGTYTDYLKDPDPKGQMGYGELDNPGPSMFDRELPIRILADADLSVTVTHPSTRARTTITGRADWVFKNQKNFSLTRYDINGYYGCFKVVQAAEFSPAEITLLADLGKSSLPPHVTNGGSLTGVSNHLRVPDSVGRPALQREGHGRLLFRWRAICFHAY